MLRIQSCSLQFSPKAWQFHRAQLALTLGRRGTHPTQDTRLSQGNNAGCLCDRGEPSHLGIVPAGSYGVTQGRANPLLRSKRFQKPTEKPPPTAGTKASLHPATAGVGLWLKALGTSGSRQETNS